MDESLRGQIPQKRQKKDHLLKTHLTHVKAQQENPDKSRPVKQPIESEAYPASTKSIRDLELIPLSDLRIETHHRGKGIIVRTISPPYRGAAAVSVVQDELGNVDKVAIYNHSDASILSNVPEGCIIAIKEPYYKFNGEKDDYMICVDHPCDVILLRFNDSIIPEVLKQDVDQVMVKTAKEWTVAGDRAFLERDLPTAVFCYTEGLDAANDDAKARSGIFAKRAGTNLLLGKWDAAQEDALASRTDGPSDWKAYLTAGRAAYGLCDFDLSRKHLDRALELRADDAAVKREHSRSAARLEEQEHGDYDFQKMFSSLGPSSVHLDNATFTARTYVSESPLHGRGLFAKEAMKAGNLVFCEKACVMPNQYGPAQASAALYAMMVRQLYDNPSRTDSVLKLHGGDYVRSGAEGTIIDGVPVVDVWLVENIRLKNGFSSPLSTREDTKPSTTANRRQARGLWPYASYMNHSCVPNTMRSFLGDMLISRAARDIAKGEELFHQYAPVKAHIKLRQQEHKETWGFECTCALCSGEAKSTDAQMEKRRKLLAEIEKLANKKPPKGMVPEANIRSMERMAKPLEDAHEKEVYDNLPRLMLIYPSMWLLEAHQSRKANVKVVVAAKELLRNFGYRVEDDDPSAMFDKADPPALMTIHVVTTLKDAANAYRALGENEIADRYMEAANKAYSIICGFDNNVSILDAPAA